MNALPDSLGLIAARLEDLERRVVVLEQSQQVSAALPPDSLPAEAPVASWPEPLPQFTSVFPVLGSALLGIAGAYLLRAISGASLLPRAAVALIAALYAGAWLYAAGRAAVGRKLAGAFYAAVSILILAPMLWEMTIRFNAMRGTTAAMILALYVAFATVLGTRRGAAVVFSVAFAGAAVAAVTLSIATHRMADFTFLLLAMLIVCELAQRKLDARGIRLLVALAADIGVWTLLLIYRLVPANRTDYPAVSLALILAAPFLLFAVELAVIARQILRDQPVPALDIAQAMAAFGLAAAALVWLTPGPAELSLGVLSLILATACYAAAYGHLRRREQRRNFSVLSVWAAILLIGAVFALAHAAAGSVALGIAAVAAIVLADRIPSSTLELQGVLFLVLAAAVSGLAAWATMALAGAPPAMPGTAALAVAACAVLAHLSAREQQGEEWRRQVLHLAPALLSGFAVAALIAVSLLGLTRRFLAPQAFHVALIRTVALCLLAIGLALAGTLSRRKSMVRTAYASLALVAAKLLFEDLRHGHMEFTAASIFAVALTLIAVPRLTRNRLAG